MLTALALLCLAAHAARGVLEPIAQVVHADDDLAASRAECEQRAAEETDKCISMWFDETGGTSCVVMLDVDCLRDVATAKYLCNEKLRMDCVLSAVYDADSDTCITDIDHFCLVQNKVNGIASWLGWQ